MYAYIYIHLYLAQQKYKCELFLFKKICKICKIVYHSNIQKLNIKYNTT